MDTESSATRRWRRALAVPLIALAGTLGACAWLNPASRNDTQVVWSTYDEAKGAIDGIVPMKTRREELAAIGLDPAENPAVTILSYSDILQKFSAGSALRPEEYDPGIRQCLIAGKRCIGYSILVRRISRQRIGNFMLDWLNFRRETNVTGWAFTATVIMVDDIVVYTLSGGQPHLHEVELMRNPLGPLQSFGWNPTSAIH